MLARRRVATLAGALAAARRNCCTVRSSSPWATFWPSRRRVTSSAAADTVEDRHVRTAIGDQVFTSTEAPAPTSTSEPGARATRRIDVALRRRR
ncbi:MAG: hypothetical protein WCG47_11670 [Dermatophilaceae bacterium]